MIRFILSDLRRMWAGALVVVLLVALAVALGVAVTLQERGLRLGSARAADKFDLIVGAAGGPTQLVLSSVFLQAAPLPLLPGETLQKLSSDPRVKWAAPIGFGDSVRDQPVVGTTTTLIAETAKGFADGRMFAQEDEAVAGAATDLAIGATVVPMHGLAGESTHQHADVRYRIVGKLKPTSTAWDRAILVPIQAVWHIHGLGEHDAHDEHDHHGFDADAALHEDWSDAELPGLPAILVKPKTIADAYKLRQDYRAAPTQAVFPAEVLTALYATMGDARAVLAAIAIGAQVLVAAALILVTVVHVGQRRRQIGALRAFGAPRGAVFALVWGELMALIGAGVALGYALGWGVSAALGAGFTAKNGVVLPVGFVPEDGIGVLALLGFAALLAAVPAWRAYAEPTVDALRA
jgi:putative ABC transport system permease protein